MQLLSLPVGYSFDSKEVALLNACMHRENFTFYVVPYFDTTGKTFSHVYFPLHLFSFVFAFFCFYLFVFVIFSSGVINILTLFAFFSFNSIPFANIIASIPRYVIRVQPSSLLIFKL